MGFLTTKSIKSISATFILFPWENSFQILAQMAGLMFRQSLQEHFLDLVSLQFTEREKGGSANLRLQYTLIEESEGRWLFDETVIIQDGHFELFSHFELLDQFCLFGQIPEDGSQYGKELVPLAR